MLSLDSVYHRAGLTKLCKKAETVGCGDTERNETQVIRAHALNELIDHIKEYRCSGESLPMADMTTLYDKRGWSFDDDLSKAVLDVKGNKTTDVFIIFKAAEYFLTNIFILSKNLQVSLLQHLNLILCKEYLSIQQEFTGFFPTTSESNSVPPILRSLLHTLLD